ncbi:MAG: hypothetical protein AAF696_07155 [Bacteroidota bacterium]
MEFIESLKERNNLLFYFGAINLIVAALLIILSISKPIVFAGANAWFKPIKFVLSTAILAFSVGWYTGYLPDCRDIRIVNWISIITLAFEVLYISWQARGKLPTTINPPPSMHLCFPLWL